jgi:putative spermidine/putrescine transport system permease protein
MPLMVGIIVRTYGWIILLGSEGLINKFLIVFHFTDYPVRLLYSQTAVLIGMIEIALPFMVLPLMSSIQSIDVSQEEAAAVLGANRLQVFYKVILPLSKPGILSGSLLVLTLSLSALAIPMFLGGPRQNMIAVLIFQQIRTTFNWPFGSAMAMILMAIVFLILFFYLKIFRVRESGKP